MKKFLRKIPKFVLALVLSGVFLLLPVFAEVDYMSLPVSTYANGLSEAQTYGSSYGAYGGVRSSYNYMSGITVSFDADTSVYSLTVAQSHQFYNCFFILPASYEVVSASINTYYVYNSFSAMVSDKDIQSFKMQTSTPANMYTLTASDFPEDATYVYFSDTSNSTVSFVLDIPAPPNAVEIALSSVPSFVSSLFSIGTSLSSFLVSTPLALISLVLSLVYFFFVGIKKLF